MRATLVWERPRWTFPSGGGRRADPAPGLLRHGTYWLAAFIVAQSFLSLFDAIGEAATFLIFAIMCRVSHVFVARYEPETKGRSLEEVQTEWVAPDGAMAGGPSAA